jgi:hypothetical protein
MRICRYCGYILAISLLCFSVGLSWATTWPVTAAQTGINSPFGPRCAGEHFHAGWDFPTMFQGADSYVYAAVAGEVESINDNWGAYGWYVIIKQPDGHRTGYMHFPYRSNIYVSLNQQVSEGTQIGRINASHPNYPTISAHLHFNYWSTTPDNDDNTIHPGRLFGDFNGNLDIWVFDRSPTTCALGVGTAGEVLAVGVGRASSGYGDPHWLFCWDYETNVRTYNYGTNDMVSDCCWYQDPNHTDLDGGDFIGIAPTDSYNFGNIHEYYYFFPCLPHEWIVNNSSYTYVLSAGGNRVTIEAPVDGFMEFRSVSYHNGTVRLVWRIHQPAQEIDSDEYDFRIQRGCGDAQLAEFIYELQNDGSGEYTLEDMSACLSAKYKIECRSRNTGEVFGELMVEAFGPEDTGPKADILVAPNPANGSTTLSYRRGPWGGDGYVEIFDLRGRLVKHFALGLEDSGTLAWDLKDANGSAVPSGVYTAFLFEGHTMATKAQLTVVK